MPLKVPFISGLYTYSCKVNIDIQKYRAKCIVLLEFFVNIKLSVASEGHTLCQVVAHARFTN